MPASVGWLDVLPIEWSRSPLKAVFEFRKGVDSQRLTAEYIGANEAAIRSTAAKPQTMG